MNFIKKKALTVAVMVDVPVVSGNENEAIQNLQTLLSNITSEELAVLSKISLKPTVKAMAISKAKLFV